MIRTRDTTRGNDRRLPLRRASRRDGPDTRAIRPSRVERAAAGDGFRKSSTVCLNGRQRIRQLVAACR